MRPRQLLSILRRQAVDSGYTVLGMANNQGTKQARLAVDTHERLMELAASLQGTADDAVRYLLGMTTVRVPVTDTQRERWAEEAGRCGVSVDEFVRLRIEACLQFGTDGVIMHRIASGVDTLCRQAGLQYRPAAKPQSTTFIEP